METEAEKLPQEKGELDDKFVVLAEDAEGFALVQFESELNTLIVTFPKRVADAMGWNEVDELQVQIAGKDALRLFKGG